MGAGKCPADYLISSHDLLNEIKGLYSITKVREEDGQIKLDA